MWKITEHCTVPWQRGSIFGSSNGEPDSVSCKIITLSSGSLLLVDDFHLGKSISLSELSVILWFTCQERFISAARLTTLATVLRDTSQLCVMFCSLNFRLFRRRISRYLVVIVASGFLPFRYWYVTLSISEKHSLFVFLRRSPKFSNTTFIYGRHIGRQSDSFFFAFLSGSFIP